MGLTHIDTLADTDVKCVIDYKTKTIKNLSGKTVLAQYDHKSERVGFTIERYIDGHDMSLSDRIAVIYANGLNSGTYIVDDVTVDDDAVIFSWLVSSAATQYVGTLTFAINFRCFDADDGTTVTYSWSTLPCTSFTISKTMGDSEQVIDGDYEDLYEALKAALQADELTKGDPGEKGDQGEAATIEVGTVTTGAAGTSASVVNSGTSSAAVLDFTIPRGNKGDVGYHYTPSVSSSGDLSWSNDGGLTNPSTVNIKGPKGDTGTGFTVKGYYSTASALSVAVTSPSEGDAYGVGTAEPYDIYIWDAVNSTWVNNGALQGAQGEKGDQGEAATITVGTVTTGDAGIDASVTNSGTENDAVLNFVIPRGEDGRSLSVSDDSDGTVTLNITQPTTAIDTTIVSVDTALSSTSTNPVQNMVIYTEIQRILNEVLGGCTFSVVDGGLVIETPD